jgi:hypothetical protein
MVRDPERPYLASGKELGLYEGSWLHSAEAERVPNGGCSCLGGGFDLRRRTVGWLLEVQLTADARRGLRRRARPVRPLGPPRSWPPRFAAPCFRGQSALGAIEQSTGCPAILSLGLRLARRKRRFGPALLDQGKTVPAAEYDRAGSGPTLRLARRAERWLRSRGLERRVGRQEIPLLEARRPGTQRSERGLLRLSISRYQS